MTRNLYPRLTAPTVEYLSDAPQSQDDQQPHAGHQPLLIGERYLERERHNHDDRVKHLHLMPEQLETNDAQLDDDLDDEHSQNADGHVTENLWDGEARVPNLEHA